MILRKHWKRDTLLAFLMGFFISLANWIFLPKEYYMLFIMLFFFLSTICLMFITSIEDFKNRYNRKKSAFEIALSLDIISVMESGLFAFTYPERNNVNWIALYILMFSFCLLFIFLILCKHFENDNTQ